MLTPEQRFIFDVQGYVVIENALSPETVAAMRKDMADHGVRDPDNDPGLSRFRDFLAWGQPWRDLIDHPAIYPYLLELLGPKFRLDHAYGMAMRADGKTKKPGHEMHHHSDLFEHGCYYVANGRVMHNGLIVVSWALNDIDPGAGGFLCIPGSHKASFPMPECFYNMAGNPLCRQVPQKAGDVLIFTEALTHGTMPWTNPHTERRSVLLKYSPAYHQWAKNLMPDNIDGLTERQRAILRGPYIGGREGF